MMPGLFPSPTGIEVAGDFVQRATDVATAFGGCFHPLRGLRSPATVERAPVGSVILVFPSPTGIEVAGDTKDVGVAAGHVTVSIPYGD